MTRATGPRLFALDALRAVAALVVVFNHWKHMTIPGLDVGREYDRASSPFYQLLWPLYEYGWLAVDLFFTLSGFIFFTLYSARVREGAIGAVRFAWLRFSRLYPLHLVTLLTVAALQFAYHSRFGEYFIYAGNDWQHFLAHLFLVTWALPGHGFNGPIWSISVEVVLYAGFFLFCRRIDPGRLKPLLAMGAIGLMMQFAGWVDLGRGVMSFFLGGVVVVALRSTELTEIRRRAPVLLAVLWLGVMLLTYAGGYLLRDIELVSPRLATLAGRFAMVTAVFPLTIFLLAAIEGASRHSFARVGAFGHASYAIYLLHFPLQLIAMYAARTLGVDLLVFQTWPVLACFLLVLVSLSFLSYRLIEAPTQLALRDFRRGARREVGAAKTL